MKREERLRGLVWDAKRRLCVCRFGLLANGLSVPKGQQLDGHHRSDAGGGYLTFLPLNELDMNQRRNLGTSHPH